MAESQVVAQQALNKLEDQLTCAICLDAFKDPKLLQCFHVFCKDCLQQLVLQDRQGQLSLCCPTCRQSTLFPPTTDVSGLQPAFHIHHLLEIQDALKKVKDPQKVQCEKCTKTTRIATNFCRDCGEFICENCTEMHSEWKELSKHEVVNMEQIQTSVNQLIPPKKVTLYCSQHKGMKLDLYCETCGELICLHCTINKHCKPEHQYDLVEDTFERHKAEIIASLKPIEKQLDVVSKALQQFNLHLQELDELEVSTEANIGQQIQQLQELLEARKAELIGQMKQYIETKKKNLAAQKDTVETVYTQLVGCLSFVRENLRTGSQGEVMKTKKTVMKQVKEVKDNFKQDMLHPCELVNVKYIPTPELAQACQQFGKVFLQQTSPEKCYIRGKALKMAEPDKRATVVLYVVDQSEKPHTSPLEALACLLVSNQTGKKMDCSAKKIQGNQYEISYQPKSRGRHQLHVKVEGEHIKGSPFPVTVKLPAQKLGTPIKIISGLKQPRGITVNQRGQIIVAESGGHCISLLDSMGGKLQSFGSEGSGDGQFNAPHGMAVDDDGNILVTDRYNHRIQKFTPDGEFITAIGKTGTSSLGFNEPIDIAIHTPSKKIYIVDCTNHRLVILNPDLTFFSSFGSYGNGNGQFAYPWGVTFDSDGNVYVADSSNHRIQVFTAEGKFLRKFGERGSGNGELNWPSSVSIDSDNAVYVVECDNHRVSVFTREGKFLTSFGTKGNGPGEFNWPRGIALDGNGIVYVSDTQNNCLQVM